MRGVQRLLIGLGHQGVLVSTPDESRLISARTGPLEDVTGGGDAAFAAAIWSLRQGNGLVAAAQAGQTAAREAVASADTVPQYLAAALGAAARGPGSSYEFPAAERVVTLVPHPDLVLSGEVRAALAAGRPVVALESTIVAHGMAYPANVETARARGGGRARGRRRARHHRRARGQPTVGLDPEELEQCLSPGS